MSITPLRSDKLLAAHKIARSLGPAEETIDNGIIAGAALLSSIVSGRMQAQAALSVGHDAVLDATAMLSSLVEARTRAVSCHERLADIRDAFRLRADDVGCTGDKHLAAAPSDAVAAA